MKKTTFLFPVVAAAVCLVGSPAAKALVALGSTYSFDLIGGSTSGGAYYLVGPSTATFGLPSTVAGPEGQTVTISSSENVGVTTTTDTFTLSTATSFITADTVNGTTINLLQFDVGDQDSGAAVPVVVPIGMYTAIGTFTDGTGASVNTATIPSYAVTTMVAGNDLSYGAAEGINTGSATTPIDAFDVHTFTYSITYQTLPAPEPSTWAMLAVAISAGVVVIRRRHKVA